MRDPKRILKKILSDGTDLTPFEQSGEPLDQLVETLREVLRIRKGRQWLIDQSGIDPAFRRKHFTACWICRRSITPKKPTATSTSSSIHSRTPPTR